MQHKKSKFYIYVSGLVTLFSALTITGISIIDDTIWNLVFLIIGMLAYVIVGILFSIGLLHGKQAGKDAYAIVSLVLIILGYFVYKGITAVQQWVSDWPLEAKIAVPTVLGLIFVALLITTIIKFSKCKKHEIDVKIDNSKQR